MGGGFSRKHAWIVDTLNYNNIIKCREMMDIERERERYIYVCKCNDVVCMYMERRTCVQ